MTPVSRCSLAVRFSPAVGMGREKGKASCCSLYSSQFRQCLPLIDCQLHGGKLLLGGCFLKLISPSS